MNKTASKTVDSGELYYTLERDAINFDINLGMVHLGAHIGGMKCGEVYCPVFCDNGAVAGYVEDLRGSDTLKLKCIVRAYRIVKLRGGKFDIEKLR